MTTHETNGSSQFDQTPLPREEDYLALVEMSLYDVGRAGGLEAYLRKVQQGDEGVVASIGQLEELHVLSEKLSGDTTREADASEFGYNPTEAGMLLAIASLSRLHAEDSSMAQTERALQRIRVPQPHDQELAIFHYAGLMGEGRKQADSKAQLMLAQLLPPESSADTLEEFLNGYGMIAEGFHREHKVAQSLSEVERYANQHEGRIHAAWLEVFREALYEPAQFSHNEALTKLSYKNESVLRILTHATVFESREYTRDEFQMYHLGAAYTRAAVMRVHPGLSQDDIFTGMREWYEGVIKVDVRHMADNSLEELYTDPELAEVVARIAVAISHTRGMSEMFAAGVGATLAGTRTYLSSIEEQKRGHVRSGDNA